MDTPLTRTLPIIRYVEDPEVVRLLQEISMRSPALAAAADHPLTELFIRWGRRANAKLSLLGLITNHSSSLMYALLIGFIFSLDYSANQWRYFEIFIILVLIYPLCMSFFRKKRSRVISWQLLLSKEDKNQWVWLSGLKLSEYASIAFVYEYWKRSDLPRLRSWLYLIFISIMIILMILERGFTSKTVLMLQIIPIGMMYIRCIFDPGVVGVKAITEAETPLNKQNFPDYGVFLGILVCIVCWAMDSLDSAILGTLIMAALCLFLEKVRRGYSDYVNWRYELLIKADEEFEKLLAPERK